MKKLAFLGGAVGVGIGALLVAMHTGHAADHADAPDVGGALSPPGTGGGKPLADINDVYAWMTSDGSKVNLAMTISPGDDGTRHFGPSTLYVFHVTSIPGFGMAGTETKVVCKFASDTSAQCWVGTKGYITGDPSNTAGITSADGKIKLFAGRRSDPFFFNLQGFRDAVKAVDGLEGSGGTGLDGLKDASGCLNSAANEGAIESAVATLRQCLTQDPNGSAASVGCPAHTTTGAPCSTTSADCFSGLNVLGIVLQIDKTLLNSGANNLISEIAPFQWTAELCRQRIIAQVGLGLVRGSVAVV